MSRFTILGASGTVGQALAAHLRAGRVTAAELAGQAAAAVKGAA